MECTFRTTGELRGQLQGAYLAPHSLTHIVQTPYRWAEQSVVPVFQATTQEPHLLLLGGTGQEATVTEWTRP